MVVLGFVFVVGLENSSVWPVQAKCRRKFFRPPIDFSCFFFFSVGACVKIFCVPREVPLSYVVGRIFVCACSSTLISCVCVMAGVLFLVGTGKGCQTRVTFLADVDLVGIFSLIIYKKYTLE